MTTGVEVKTDAGGAGRVTVEVALDREAASRAPDLRPRVADLRRAGWEVRGPVTRPDGGKAISARKRFASVEEATQILAEVGEPLTNVRLTRSRSFAKTRTAFAGTIDLSRGVETFSDAELARQLGGRPLGVDPARLDEVNDALTMRVRAQLPGGGATWEAKAGDRTAMRASAEAWNTWNLFLALLSLLCAIGAVVAIRRRI